ncbi:MAG: hypothetical protein FWD69_10985 [Polyangiaceae bacterium]|nr:hypothetical protein [Polyangiaceae bacterium]
MNRKTLVGALIAIVGLVPLIANCGAGGVGGVAGKAGGIAPGMGGKCPDLSTPESIVAFDFASNFKVSPEAAVKLKASTAAAVQLKGFAERIDADLKLSCGNIAKDLGAGADFKDGHAACEAAAKAIGDAKARVGANARLAVVIEAPKCAADLHAYGDCAARCDGSVSAGSAKIECEPGKLSGRCDATCEGSCDVEAGAKCDGTCSGRCDADVKGTCSGKCTGKCDGKDSKGAACAGTCSGKCDGTIQATCSGKCSGDCKIKAQAKCEGTCSGKCSAEFKEPKCTGEVKPPHMSVDCKAHCDAEITANLECTQARVGITATGVADARAFEALKMTLEKNLPTVLKVSMGLGERVPRMAKNVQTMVQGTLSGFGDIAKSAGGNAVMTSAQLTACFADTYKSSVAAAAGLEANVSVSVSVSASVNGSASGSGRAGATAMK